MFLKESLSSRYFEHCLLYQNCVIPRSSHQRRSVWKGVLRNFAKLTEKHQRQSLFFNKVTGLRPKALLKKRLWHRCFPVYFAKFLTAPFLQNTSKRLLLNTCKNEANSPDLFSELRQSVNQGLHLLVSSLCPRAETVKKGTINSMLQCFPFLQHYQQNYEKKYPKGED